MDIPAPVNLKGLESILARSKQVMGATDAKFPTGKQNKIQESYDEPSFDTPMYSELDERDLPFTHTSSSEPSGPVVFNEEQIMSSKLPESVKLSFIKHNIPKLTTMPSKVTAESIEKLVGKGNIPANKKLINESIKSRPNNSDMITISKSELKEMIDARVMEILTQNYTKTITEQAIKKTISTLINEGKLNIKKRS